MKNIKDQKTWIRQGLEIGIIEQIMLISYICVCLYILKWFQRSLISHVKKSNIKIICTFRKANTLTAHVSDAQVQQN
jgi:hypothetical protein